MSPEEKAILERSLQLSEENNIILKKLQKTARWSTIWSFVKILIIFIPLAVGYLFLQPYLGSAASNLKEMQELLK